MLLVQTGVREGAEAVEEEEEQEEGRVSLGPAEVTTDLLCVEASLVADLLCVVPVAEPVFACLTSWVGSWATLEMLPEATAGLL